MRKLEKRSGGLDPSLLRQEAEKRKSWRPFYSFAGGGDYLCLDHHWPLRLWSYEALTWTVAPQTWDFILALSFTESFNGGVVIISSRL